MNEEALKATATIEACKLTHQLWIDYWKRHRDGECSCGEDHVTQSKLVGSRQHHESINSDYDNVLMVIQRAA